MRYEAFFEGETAKRSGKHTVSAEEGRHSVRAWSFEDVLLELYRYAPGPAEELPKHAHEEYQMGFSVDFPGEYHYRGERFGVPAGSLSIVHPGEMHSARDLEYRRDGATFRMMYAKPELLGTAATEVAGRETAEPFFAEPIILEGDLVRPFLELHVALGESVSRLEQDARLLAVLTGLISRHADTRPSPRPAGRERRAVRLVREYLEDNYAENVSLEDLARLANLSPYYLSRVFSREVGLPPHRYQVQVRVGRARALLAGGTPIEKVAAKTGFADQSHLARHFKRFVQVPPGRYLPQNRKNVQDGGSEAP